MYDCMRYVRHRTKVILNYAACAVKLLLLRLHGYVKGSSREIIGVALIEHLGDIVACEPIARFLRREYPNTIIVWCVRSQYRALIDAHPDIDVTLVVHCLTVKEMLIRSGVFTRTVDLHFKERYCSLCGESYVRENHGSPSTISLQNYFHHGGILASFSRYAGLSIADEGPNINIPSEIERSVERFSLPERYIVIHCVSNNVEKDWPQEKWKSFVERVIDSYNISVIEVGQETVLDDMQPPLYRNLRGRSSILETAYLIKKAAMFVGIDSGPAHLANAVGTYGILLMGNYLNFKNYNPFSGGYGDGSNVQILYSKDEVRNIAVKDVIQAFDSYAQSWKAR